MKNNDDVDKYKKCLQEYEKASGAKVNYSKSTTLMLGNNDLNTKTEKLKKNETVTYLGFELAVTNLCTEKSIQQALVKSQRTVNTLQQNKKLKMLDKVMVANSCLVARFRYLLNVLNMNQLQQRSFYKIIREWLWNTRKSKVPFGFVKGPVK